MGRKDKKRQWKNQRDHTKDKRHRPGADRWPARGEPAKENPRFEAFYRCQQIVPPEQWDAHLEALRSPLPASFRINTDCTFGETLKAELHAFAAKVVAQQEQQEQQQEGKAADADTAPAAPTAAAVQRPCYPLPWFPGGLAFQLGTDRLSIRRNPALARLKAWLIAHTASGAITRQEAVSMIPPLVLQVAPHHTVLDMCAAPGSKTTQMLEVVQQSTGTDPSRPGEPIGLVMANDSDTKRAYMLSHQCKRISSAGLMIVTHKGQHLPNVNLTKAFLDAAGSSRTSPEGVFDRVLCDVPCSGDGTARKLPAIWKSWKTAGGTGLHCLQSDIALRGAALLKVGGKMVYSTCSMNPLENEAVIVSLLRRAKGALRLVHPTKHLSGLKWRPGMHSWHVMEELTNDRRKELAEITPKPDAGEPAEVQAAAGDDKASPLAPGKATDTGAHEAPPPPAEFLAAATAAGLHRYPSWDFVPIPSRQRLRSSMFPPPPHETEEMKLELCMRCVPHDQDTGGFFVALLEKVRPIPYGNKHATPAAAASSSVDQRGDQGGGRMEDVSDTVLGAIASVAPNAKSAAAPTDGSGGGGGGAESDAKATADAKAAIAQDDEPPKKRMKGEGEAQSTNAEFDLRAFPLEAFAPIKEFYDITDTFPLRQLFSRTENPRVVTMMTRTALDSFVQKDERQQLKVVSLGLKVFEKNSANSHSRCAYRITQDGVPLVEPHMTDKRKVVVAPEQFAKILKGGTVPISAFDAATAGKIDALEIGAVLIMCDPPPVAAAAAQATAGAGGGGAAAAAPVRLMAVVWRGRGGGLNVLCHKDTLRSFAYTLVAGGVEVDGVVAKFDSLLSDEPLEAETPAAAAEGAAEACAPAAGVPPVDGGSGDGGDGVVDTAGQAEPMETEPAP